MDLKLQLKMIQDLEWNSHVNNNNNNNNNNSSNG